MSETQTIDRLPDSPSELVRLGMKDLEACQQDEEHFVIDFGEWLGHRDVYVNDEGEHVTAAEYADWDEYTNMTEEEAQEYEADGGEPVAEVERRELCAVCMAGAVMARSLLRPDQLDAGVPWFPNDFDDDTCAKLEALDCFRVGGICSGLSRMGCVDEDIERQNEIDHGDYDLDVTPFSDAPGGFWKDMEAVAQQLEELGL